MSEVIGFVLTVLLVVSFFVALAWLDDIGNPREAEAIQRGYALHCPQTGDFAWKGECDE